MQTVLDPSLIIPEDAILVTLDVKALYTNIPHDKGIGACLKALDEFYQNVLPLPIKYFKQMMDLILKRNYCMQHRSIHKAVKIALFIAKLSDTAE